MYDISCKYKQLTLNFQSILNILFKSIKRKAGFLFFNTIQLTSGIKSSGLACIKLFSICLSNILTNTGLSFAVYWQNEKLFFISSPEILLSFLISKIHITPFIPRVRSVLYMFLTCFSKLMSKLLLHSVVPG
jgi:hypothetical protein